MSRSLTRFLAGTSLTLLLTTGSAGAAQDPAPNAPTDLMSVYVAALDHNPSYLAATAKYREALEAHPQAVAKLLPQVAAIGQVADIEQSISGNFFVGVIPGGNGQGIQSNHSDEFKQYTYTVGLTQAIYHRDLWLQLDQADLQQARAALLVGQALDSLRLAVATAYFGELGAQDKARLAQAQRDALREIAKQSKIRGESGLQSQSDTRAAQAAADQAQAALLAARNAQSIAELKLQEVVGDDTPVSLLAPLSDDVNLPPPTPDDAAAWVQAALANNLSVKAARFKARIAKLKVKEAYGKRWPQLDAYALRTYRYADGGISNGIGAGNNHGTDSRVMLQLKIPIYSGGAIRSAVRAAVAGVDADDQLQRAAVSTARLNARSAFLNAQASLAEISALQQLVESAKGSEESARTDYEVGTRTYSSLLQAIRQRYQAEVNYSQARYAYLLSTLKLKAAAGELSAIDLRAINRWLH
jgi:type I secretion outer membrane protein, TolC family